MLRKIRQGPPGPWTPGARGRTPLDSPALCPSGIGCDNLNPQASSIAPHPPHHGLTAGGCFPGKARGENKTNSPTRSKWKIGLFLCLKPYLGGAATPQGGNNVPPSGGPGAQPRHAFGSFRRETKGTPGVGRVGPLVEAGAESVDLLPRGHCPSQRSKRRRERNPFPASLSRGFFLI